MPNHPTTYSSHALKLAEQQPERRPLIGQLLIVLFFCLATAVVIAIIGVVIWFLEMQDQEIPSGSGKALFTTSALFGMYLFYPLYYIGRKYTAKSALTILKSDQRSPILYLRSFEDDGDPLAGRWWRDPLKLAGVLTSITPTGQRKVAGATQEEALVTALKKFGPVVAIGRPGERLPTLGAARIYMDDDGWQDAVKAVASDAQFIVLGMGASDGLKWEYDFVFRELEPRKVVIFLDIVKGRDQNARYEAFREFMVSNYEIWLPNDLYQSALITSHGPSRDIRWT